MSNGHECRCVVAEPHETFGQCMRAKNIRVAYCQSWKGADATRQKKWDRELDSYATARRQGIQPDGTTNAKIHYAEKASNALGAAYGTPAFTKAAEKKALERSE